MGTTWFKVYSVDHMCDEVELQIHLLNRLKTSRLNKSLFVDGIFGLNLGHASSFTKSSSLENKIEYILH